MGNGQKLSGFDELVSRELLATGHTEGLRSLFSLEEIINPERQESPDRPVLSVGAQSAYRIAELMRVLQGAPAIYERFTGGEQSMPQELIDYYSGLSRPQTKRDAASLNADPSKPLPGSTIGWLPGIRRPGTKRRREEAVADYDMTTALEAYRLGAEKTLLCFEAADFILSHRPAADDEERIEVGSHN
jgi:hypothetical protein